MTTVEPPGPVPTRAQRGALAGIGRRPITAAALAVVTGVTAAVIAAPLLASHPPLEQDLLNALAGPSAAHPLGTDGLGRDVLSRLLYGGRTALGGVGLAVLVFAVLGMLLGVVAGYLRGRTDRVIAAVLDIMLAVPAIIIMLAVLAIFGQSNAAAMLTLGFFASANLARTIRSSCLTLRQELFVDAARVSGLGPARIMARHILPGLIGQMLVQVCLFAGIALGVQTGLGFLNLATPPPAPSWGGMVGEAAQVLQQDPYLLLISGGVIGLMSICFGLLGDGLRDIEEERRRGTGGRLRRPATEAIAADHAKPPDGAVLAVRDYSIDFATVRGTRRVVDSIGFTVHPGEIFGLVGESGSGKTVTGLSLLGLLPANGAVASGSAWLAGARISGLPERALRRIRGRDIALVSQDPMVALDPNFTIGSQLSEVVRRVGAAPAGKEAGPAPAGKEAVRKRVRELLTSVHLPDPDAVARRHPHELSGGMLQRVAIAMALAAPRSC